MATLQFAITRIRPQSGLVFPSTVSLYIKPYYDDNFTLVDSTVTVDSNGYVLDSPVPQVTIETSEPYVLRAVNNSCGFDYRQTFNIYPYCPVGYELSPDESYCYYEEVTEATPPTSPEVAVEVNFGDYSACGSVIYDPGYNVLGNGTYTPINPANPWWRNGAVLCAGGNNVDGPLNRAGLWATTPLPDQTIGYSICITVPVTKTYYLGLGFDNFGRVVVDSEVILQADYASTTLAFFYWSIYPIELTQGTHLIEVTCYNLPGSPPNPGVIGIELYDNTPAEIEAATDYTGLNLLFSTKDEIGNPIQIGSDGVGWSCPAGYSLSYCESPIVCKRFFTTPILY